MLSHPDQMTINRVLGADSAEARLDFGITSAAEANQIELEHTTYPSHSSTCPSLELATCLIFQHNPYP